MMPQLLTTPEAERDLISIGSYIAEDDAAAAEKLLANIQKKFEMLAASPGVGRARGDLAPDLRSFPVGRYLIFYMPLSNGVAVIRVLHGARDLRRIFRNRRRT